MAAAATHTALPPLDFTTQAPAHLPVPPYLQRLRLRSYNQSWRPQGRLAGNQTNTQMPPLQPRRAGSRALSWTRNCAGCKAGQDTPNGAALKIKRLALLSLALLLASTAAARVEFALNEFPVFEFRNLEKVTEVCAAPAAASFWCGHEGETLIRIPTKGADFFFNDAGELYAVFAKQQKGQTLNN